MWTDVPWLHVHCWHTPDFFSKHSFLEGKYSDDLFSDPEFNYQDIRWYSFVNASNGKKRRLLQQAQAKVSLLRSIAAARCFSLGEHRDCPGQLVVITSVRSPDADFQYNVGMSGRGGFQLQSCPCSSCYISNGVGVAAPRVTSNSIEPSMCLMTEGARCHREIPDADKQQSYYSGQGRSARPRTRSRPEPHAAGQRDYLLFLIRLRRSPQLSVSRLAIRGRVQSFGFSSHLH